MPGPSVFPSGEPGVSGDFWGCSPWGREESVMTEQLHFHFSLSWQIDGETMETVTDFILGVPKSLQMLTAAMKLKDACSLECLWRGERVLDLESW